MANTGVWYCIPKALLKGRAHGKRIPSHLSPVVSLVPVVLVHGIVSVQHLWGHVRLRADDAVAHHHLSPRGRESEISDLQACAVHVGGWARDAEIQFDRMYDAEVYRL